MAKKTIQERMEGIEKWQEKMDWCLHAARVLMGLFWATVTTISALIYTFWENIKHFLLGLQR